MLYIRAEDDQTEHCYESEYQYAHGLQPCITLPILQIWLKGTTAAPRDTIRYMYG